MKKRFKVMKRILICLILIPCLMLFSACGKAGLSAYEIAVNNGFIGTEAEWLASLKGDAGQNGTNGTDGTNGTNGADAISSFAVWQEAYDNHETTLSYAEWLKTYFDIVIDAEKYAINKNLLSVVEVTRYTSLNDLILSQNSSGSGSGVIYKIDDNGDVYIVTNYHVAYKNGYAKNAYPYFKLKFYQQDNYHYMTATFVGGSATYDVAVLKVEAKDFISNTNAKPVTVATTPLSAGSAVIAIGNLGGNGINISRGVIDVVSDNFNYTAADYTCIRRLIQHDAYIKNGNSGGGLFNLDGDFVGITNGGETNDTDNQYKYAIPADLVQRVANQLIENYKADSSSYKLKTVDLKISNLTCDTFSSLNETTGLVEVVEQVKITEVSEDSIFYNKLLADDIYVSMTVNGVYQEIDRAYFLSEMLIDARVNDEIKIKVKRKNENQEYDELEFSVQVSAEDFVYVR